MIRPRAIAWAVLAAGLGTATAVLFIRGTPVEANLLALLPGVATNPVVEQATAKLGDAAARRTVFLVGARSNESVHRLAREFGRSLATADVFREVRAEFPPPNLDAVREIYLPHRFHLLTQADRQAIAAVPSGSFIEERLRRRLHDPFRPTLGVPIERDPLGLLDNYLTTLPYSRLGAALEFDDGLLLARDAGRSYAVVLAELNGSPHDPDMQKRLGIALRAAETALRKIDTEVTILRAGVVHYAAAARETAEREVDRIGLGSLIGIAALLLLVFRSLRPLLLGLVSVATGVCAAILATVGVFGGIHLITLVFGASLIGEAIDYSIQYFAARLDAGKAWTAQRGLRAVFPGITLAVVTSVLGYSALALTPFPALRQIALFSIVGLIVAYLTVVFLLPAFARAPAKHRPESMLRVASRFWVSCEGLRRPRSQTIIVAVLVLVSLPGWMQLQAADDIRLLINPPAELVSEEDTVRRLTGFTQGSQFFVIEGRDVEEVLLREEALTARLNEQVRAGTLQHYQAISDFVPSAKRQQETYALWQRYVFAPRDGVVPALARVGFRKEIAADYVADFRKAAGRTLTLDAWLQSAASTPFRHLWLGEIAGRYATAVLPSGFSTATPLAQAAEGLAGVTLVDKAGEVSRLFREFRRIGSIMLFVAVLAVYAVLAWRYRWRGAFSALLPTLIAMGLTLGCYGYAGTPLTLFNIMALLLVLGVGVNYVIFLHEGFERREAALIGVLLSAATTLLSFGLLGWSATPALSQFGMTLFIGITATVLLAPLLGPTASPVRR